MARAHRTPIAPFPATVDRFRFGDWLSGLTDGEGSFIARHDPQRPKTGYAVSFAIAMRADEQPVLEMIRSFFGCGGLNLCSCQNKATGSKPQVKFHVTNTSDLISVVVSHFHLHPLRAKKARDFVLWEEAVRLAHQVCLRKRRFRSPGVRGHLTGTFPRWTESERNQFTALVNAIRSQRKYNAAAVEIPARPPRPEPPTLFDWRP